MSETFVRLKPRDEWRTGYDKERLVDEMRASLDGDPGRALQLLAADQGQRRGGGDAACAARSCSRSSAPISRRCATTLEQAKARRSRRPRHRRPRSISRRDRCRSCRSSSTARRSRAPASPVEDAAATSIETALAGKRRDYHLGRRAARAGAPDAVRRPARETEQKIGDRRGAATPSGAQHAAARARAIEVADGAAVDLPRGQQPLPRAQVQRRGPRHGLGREGRAPRSCATR